MTKREMQKREEFKRILEMAKDTFKRRMCLAKNEKKLKEQKEELEEKENFLKEIDETLNLLDENKGKIKKHLEDLKESNLNQIKNLPATIYHYKGVIELRKEDIEKEEEQLCHMSSYINGVCLIKDEYKGESIEILLYFIWVTKIKLDDLFKSPSEYLDSLRYDHSIYEKTRNGTIYSEKFEDIFKIA